MPDIRWVDHHIETTPCKKPKKITATRLATILGMNKWSTPFEVWCAVSRVYEKPFEDTIFTKTGKILEPVQIAYMKDTYAMNNLRTPTDIYGADYFKKTYGDFYPNVKVLGGMWDSLLVNEDGTANTVLEFKTTKRAEDWGNDVPEYYAIQASLYAYLLGVDDVIMVASFLDPADYEHPQDFVPSVHNTITKPFKVSQKYPNFQQMVAQAVDWWNNYVVTGISPDYDEDADAEILSALKTNSITPQASNLTDLLKESETLMTEIAEAEDAIITKVKRLDAIKKLVKEYMSNQFRDNDSKVTLTGSTYTWELSRSVRTELDTERMKQDGIYDQYSTIQKVSDRLNIKKI